MPGQMNGLTGGKLDRGGAITLRDIALQLVDLYLEKIRGSLKVIQRMCPLQFGTYGTTAKHKDGRGYEQGQGSLLQTLIVSAIHRWYDVAKEMDSIYGQDKGFHDILLEMLMYWATRN